MKVVLNITYGGFKLSEKALKEYCKRKNIESIYDSDIPRHDPDLVDIVETMGDEANGKFSQLEIVNVDYEIECFDGMEKIWVGINK